MIRATNGTTVEHIAPYETEDLFKFENLEMGFEEFSSQPRSMELSEEDVAIMRFPFLTFEQN